jgi:very-short-patch-repair endonuclease
MILDKEIEIKITNRNINHYKEKGYNVKLSEKIIIKTEDLTFGSHDIIKVKCDKCNKEKYIKFQSYLKNINNGNYYACCQKCSKEKYKNTCLKLYGCENLFQSTEIKEKIKQTNLKLYNVENPSQNKEIKDKKIQTCLLNNGVKNPQQNKEIYEKTQLTGKKIKYYNDNLYYRGTYEKDFLDLCFEQNIKIKNVKGFKYKFQNKQKIYFPDFYIPDYNLIIEIKSDYYYIKELEKNLLKESAMIDYGYNFLFIINKNYEKFLNLISKINLTIKI